MRIALTAISFLAIAAATPALAQNMAASAGTMSPTDVGAQPMMGTPSPNYVAWAADSDMYEIQSSKLALSKGKSDMVKSHARQMIKDHTMTTKTLLAALPKTQPKVPKPPMQLSEPNAAKIAALKQASADSFDSLYLQQQLQAHQQAWSLHKGYGTDGTDPALRQVATSAVPIIESHLQNLKTGHAM
jgi:putative membrane protein